MTSTVIVKAHAGSTMEGKLLECVAKTTLNGSTGTFTSEEIIPNGEERTFHVHGDMTASGHATVEVFERKVSAAP